MNKELELARELVKRLEEAEKGNKVRLSELNPSDTFKIGEYDFIVLEHLNGMTKVISKDFMAKNVKFDDDGSRDYNSSYIRRLIEADIQPVIEKEVGSKNLIEHTVNLTSIDMQREFKDCKCKVRLITFDEARQYNDLLVNSELDDWWWTCTPWSTSKRGWGYLTTVVSPSGCVNNYFCDSRNGVRPVCILKSNIFVSKRDK